MKRSHDEAFAWRDYCIRLIVEDKPLLIAFDLDYTLWPCYCHEHTLGPYTKVDESSVLCKDRRTSVAKTLRLYPQVIQVVQLLREADVRLSLASRSPDLTAARGILSALDLWGHFIHPQIYSGRKTNHFRLIRSATEIPYHRMLFFDDEPSNIEAVRAMGVVGCLINKKEGLSPQVLLKGLKAFTNAQKATMSMQRWLAPTTKKAYDSDSARFSFEEADTCESLHTVSRGDGDEIVLEVKSKRFVEAHCSNKSGGMDELQVSQDVKQGCVQPCIDFDDDNDVAPSTQRLRVTTTIVAAP